MVYSYSLHGVFILSSISLLPSPNHLRTISEGMSLDYALPILCLRYVPATNDLATPLLWFYISAGDGWERLDALFPVSRTVEARLCSLCSSCLCLRIALFRPLSAMWNNIPECRWPFLRMRFSSSGLQLFLRRLHPLVPNLQPFHPRLQPLNWRLLLLCP